jgi:predicted ester cyclase
MNPLHALIEEVMNNGRLEVIDELLAADYRDEDVYPGRPPDTRDSFKSFVQELRAALPDLHFEPLDECQVGDQCWGRYLLSGTMRGSLFGQAPTGKRAEGVRELHWVHVDADGRIDRHFGSGDDIGLFVQLGIRYPFPEPE